MADPTQSRATTGIAPGYLHGYSEEEQRRLVDQARFLEQSVYSHIDLKGRSELLEVGCGVGAQTEILLERFPHIRIQGIDASEAQIQTARRRLAQPMALGRVSLEVGDALHLPFDENRFDAAFVCWLLEHVQEPVGILREIHRALRAGGIIYCTEVLNATLYLHPYSPATLQYWFAFNDHQWSLNADPFVGGKLANYLLAAGYQNISTEVKVLFHDSRAPKQRSRAIAYWTSLLLSGAPALLQAGKVTESLVDGMQRELQLLKDDPDTVFFIPSSRPRPKLSERLPARARACTGNLTPGRTVHGPGRACARILFGFRYSSAVLRALRRRPGLAWALLNYRAPEFLHCNYIAERGVWTSRTRSCGKILGSRRCRRPGLRRWSKAPRWRFGARPTTAWCGATC